MAQKNDGHTLFQHVKKKKCEATLAGRYIVDEVWDSVEANYKISVAKPCKVLNKTEVVDPALVSALNAAKTKDMTMRSRTALCSWFKSCTSLNQRSLSGIIAHLVKLSPAANANAAHVVLAFLKLCHKLELKEQFEDQSAITFLH